MIMKIFHLITFTVFLFMSCGCNGADKKEIRASEIIKLMEKGKPVQMVGKIILDDLDFTTGSEPFILNENVLQGEIQSNIFFDDCIFMGKVTSSSKREKMSVQACFRNNLVFVGCDFRGEVDFDGAIVFGTVNFGRSIFREDANFSNMTVWAKDGYFSEMKAEKAFLMIYASFSGNLFFPDAFFGGNASFQETSVKGKLMMNNSTFAERAGFDLMEVQGNAFFNYAKFEKTADFSRSRFMYTADFVKTTFDKTADFEKASFMNTVNFDGVDRSHLIFTDTFFGNNQHP